MVYLPPSRKCNVSKTAVCPRRHALPFSPSYTTALPTAMHELARAAGCCPAWSPSAPSYARHMRAGDALAGGQTARPVPTTPCRGRLQGRASEPARHARPPAASARLPGLQWCPHGSQRPATGAGRSHAANAALLLQPAPPPPSSPDSSKPLPRPLSARAFHRLHCHRPLCAVCSSQRRRRRRPQPSLGWRFLTRT